MQVSIKNYLTTNICRELNIFLEHLITCTLHLDNSMRRAFINHAIIIIITIKSISSININRRLVLLYSLRYDTLCVILQIRYKSIAFNYG